MDRKKKAMDGYKYLKARQDYNFKHFNTEWIEDLLRTDEVLKDLYYNNPVVHHTIEAIRAGNICAELAFAIVIKTFADYKSETDKRLIEAELLTPNQIVTNCEKILECPYKKDKKE